MEDAQRQAPAGTGGESATAFMQRLLGAVASPSREIVDQMASAGYSPKQIRGARVRLGVRVTRTGSGGDSRSFWALPAWHDEGTTAPERPDPDRSARTRATPRGTSVPPGQTAGPERSARAREDVASVKASLLAPVGAATASFTDDESERIQARAAVMVQRGMGESAARRLAVRLVIERDRLDVHATGSCIECQVRDECPSVRPSDEIHQCWQRRVDCP